MLSSATYAKDMLSPFLKTSRRLINVREHRWQDAVLKGLHHLHSHHARPSGRVPVTKVANYKEYKRIGNQFVVLHLNVRTGNPSNSMLEQNFCVEDPGTDRIDSAVLDPDPYKECRSGSRSL